MKHYNLNIVNSDEKILNFGAFEPETDIEIYEILSHIKSENDAIIYFPIKPSPCIKAIWFNTKNSKNGIDFLFIDWCGTIQQIDSDIPPLSDKIHICAYANCAIALKSGTAHKNNINVGDSVIHEKLNRTKDNNMFFNGTKFIPITKNNYSKINIENIVMLEISDTSEIKIFTEKYGKKQAFFIDRVNYDSEKIRKIFPILYEANTPNGYISNKKWKIYNRGMGNVVFMKEK